MAGGAINTFFSFKAFRRTTDQTFQLGLETVKNLRKEAQKAIFSVDCNDGIKQPTENENLKRVKHFLVFLVKPKQISYKTIPVFCFPANKLHHASQSNH